MKYKTPPEEDLYIAAGGDVGSTEVAANMSKLVASKKPDIILIGGDLSYGDGNRGCYASWDGLFDMFQTSIYDEMGYHVPIMYTIGNHEYGGSSARGMPTSFDLDDIPLWFVYIPTHTTVDGGIPEIQDRRSFSYTVLGENVIFSLDSGYFQNADENMPDFMTETINKYPGYNKMAIYHEPIYAVTNRDESRREVLLTYLESWRKIFDEQNFVICFENHEHLFKVTHPLKDNQINHECGTTYIGEGAWGINPREMGDDLGADINKFQAIVGELLNVWFVRIHGPGTSSYHVEAEAFTIDGSLI